MQTKHQKLIEEYPFLTVIAYAGNEYLGIIQNIDNHVASLYVYDRLTDTQERIKFLELGEEWWWETNRKLPINIALLNRWHYQYCIQSFNVKQMEVIVGPEVRLSNSITKRIKRRSINLVKKNH
jgi:hypothetical protein|tara:strand:+ start:1314 stop:1685 length:372 start_codon:yes stop_codon:yes gene_type:complete